MMPAFGELKRLWEGENIPDREPSMSKGLAAQQTGVDRQRAAKKTDRR